MRIVVGKYKNTNATVVSLTNKQVYVELPCGTNVRINRGSVVKKTDSFAAGRKGYVNRSTPDDGVNPKYEVGRSVLVVRHRNFFTKAVLPEEGKSGTIAKSSRCYVWVRLPGRAELLQKAKHNVLVLDEKQT